MAPKKPEAGENRVLVTSWVKGTKDEGDDEARRQAVLAQSQNPTVALTPQQQAALGVLMNPGSPTGVGGPQSSGTGYQSYGPNLEAPAELRNQLRKRDDFMSTVVAVAADALGGVNSGQTTSKAISEAGGLPPPDNQLYSRLKAGSEVA